MRKDAIADPHWEACGTCIHALKSGCECYRVSLDHAEDEDEIICLDYEEKDD